MAQRLASLAVTYPASRLRIKSPLSVRIRQNQFMHDMAVVRYNDVTSASPLFRSGSPIRIAYGYQHEQQAEYLGYVLWAKAKRSGTGNRAVTYLDVACIGASRLLQQPAHRVHNNLTANQIVRTVAQEHNFDVLRGNLTERWPKLVNAGKSDFQHLMAVAKKHGHTFYVHNTTICMYDPVDYLLKHRDSWPRLRHEPGPTLDTVIGYEGGIGDQGDLFEETGVQRLFTVDPLTNDVIQAADTNNCAPHIDEIFSEPPFDLFLDDIPVDSLQEANQVVEGAALASRWRHQMRLSSYGDQRVHQGTGVTVIGVNDDSDGLWYVNSTEHEITRVGHYQQYSYSMELNLWRDSRTLKAVPPPTSTKPERRLDEVLATAPASTGFVYGAELPETGPILRAGSWVTNHPRREVLAA